LVPLPVHGRVCLSRQISVFFIETSSNQKLCISCTDWHSHTHNTFSGPLVPSPCSPTLTPTRHLSPHRPTIITTLSYFIFPSSFPFESGWIHKTISEESVNIRQDDSLLWRCQLLPGSSQIQLRQRSTPPRCLDPPEFREAVNSNAPPGKLHQRCLPEIQDCALGHKGTTSHIIRVTSLKSRIAL